MKIRGCGIRRLRKMMSKKPGIRRKFGKIIESFIKKNMMGSFDGFTVNVPVKYVSKGFVYLRNMPVRTSVSVLAGRRGREGRA